MLKTETVTKMDDYFKISQYKREEPKKIEILQLSRYTPSQ